MGDLLYDILDNEEMDCSTLLDYGDQPDRTENSEEDAYSSYADFKRNSALNPLGVKVNDCIADMQGRTMARDFGFESFLRYRNESHSEKKRRNGRDTESSSLLSEMPFVDQLNRSIREEEVAYANK